MLPQFSQIHPTISYRMLSNLCSWCFIIIYAKKRINQTTFYIKFSICFYMKHCLCGKITKHLFSRSPDWTTGGLISFFFCPQSFEWTFCIISINYKNIPSFLCLPACLTTITYKWYDPISKLWKKLSDNAKLNYTVLLRTRL